MKRIILVTMAIVTIATCLSFLSDSDRANIANANKFSVINVQGQVVFQSSGEEMKRGDVYVSGTKLNFASNVSRAAIVNKTQGRFVLTGNSKGKVKVLPAANNISSRAGALLNIVDLKKHFSERYLVLKRSEVQVSHKSFPMDKENFFYLTYEHEGEEIAKKLGSEGDFLILDKDEIFKIDGKAIPVEEKDMTLYYRKDGKGMKINQFIPIFADNDLLVDEVSLLLQSFEDEKDNVKIDEVTAHLIEFHGTPHKQNLKSWLEAEFKLKSK
ncbi:MAG: hypothetical protein ACI857_001613 [Arenicella sp.]|jgi:hypothetical protein